MVAACNTFPQSLKCCPDGTPAIIIPPDTLVCPVPPVIQPIVIQPRPDPQPSAVEALPIPIPNYVGVVLFVLILIATKRVLR